MTVEESKEIFVFAMRDFKQYWNLKRKTLRTLKNNKLHRHERIKQIVKRKMKHIK